ncbi:MAG: hypothetical protein LBP91_04445 [Coriobacteriales bacterium]|jgi:hypothetical protein|nr:hypothetical protein [Coriobacteriales bacterium]
MKVPRQRIRAAKPVRNIVISYFVMMAVLLTFLLGLYLLAALEFLLLS